MTTAHPLFGEVLREELPNLRLRRYRLEMAKQLESGVEPRPAELVRAALWRLESGETPDLHTLLEAAAAARVFSLDTAERLARGVVEGGGPVAATLLLAEILTHTGRSDRAAALIAQLPPESLDSADREALVYCAAVGQGLAAGDAEHGVDLVEPIIAGDPDASVQLRALHVSLLAFDARIDETLALGRSLVDDEQVAPQARALAGVGVVGAEYWLGRSAQAVAYADSLMMAARQARESLPYAEPSLQLIAICALLDQGNPGDAEQRAQGMRRQALADNDPFAIHVPSTVSAEWRNTEACRRQPSDGSGAVWRQSVRSTSSSAATCSGPWPERRPPSDTSTARSMHWLPARMGSV